MIARDNFNKLYKYFYYSLDIEKWKGRLVQAASAYDHVVYTYIILHVPCTGVT